MLFSDEKDNFQLFNIKNLPLLVEAKKASLERIKIPHIQKVRVKRMEEALDVEIDSLAELLQLQQGLVNTLIIKIKTTPKSSPKSMMKLLEVFKTWKSDNRTIVEIQKIWPTVFGDIHSLDAKAANGDTNDVDFLVNYLDHIDLLDNFVTNSAHFDISEHSRIEYFDLSSIEYFDQS